MCEGLEKENHLVRLSSPHTYDFNISKFCMSNSEERMNEILLKMVEAQMTQGSLWPQGRQLKESCNSTHTTGPESTTKDVLVSHTLPRRSGSHSIYVNSNSLRRAKHTEGLHEENLPIHPNNHTYCCSSCIFWCYNKHISNYHQNTDPLLSNLQLLSLRICSPGLHISRGICEHR